MTPFILTDPTPAQRAMPSPLTRSLCPSLHVLLVEDNMMIQLVLQRNLDKLGARVTTHATAESAWAQPIPADCRLIILDIGLPGASGIEFAAWVHRQPNPPPVVVLSAHLDDERRQQCARFGVKAAYRKPLPSEQLRAIVAQYVSGGVE